MSPARIPSMFPHADMAVTFQGQDPRSHTHFLSSYFLGTQQSIYSFFFFSSPTEKDVMLFNVTSQLSHHFNFFQGEAPHTETHNATQ